MDYDYSKAYGGGGDTSVVSSVGGTLGDATRQTAGEVAAGRLALGASYDDNIRDSSRIPREQVIVVEAPAGKLGVVIDTPDDGAPVVHAVKDTSVIANQIQVGDKLIKVDDEDVRSMTAIKVSKLISKKSANPVRRLTIVRTSQSRRKLIKIAQIICVYLYCDCNVHHRNLNHIYVLNEVAKRHYTSFSEVLSYLTLWSF